MNNLEKHREYLRLFTQQKISISDIYHVLEDSKDIETNYHDYMTTKPIDCEIELERVLQADYKTCCALLTMILREDYFCEGSFEKRYEKGQVEFVGEVAGYLGIGDENIYAIGRKAQEQLGLSKEQYIRHPSYGGQIECQKKIMGINIKKSPI